MRPQINYGTTKNYITTGVVFSRLSVGKHKHNHLYLQAVVMQHVKTKWLRIFNYSMVGASAVLFLVYILFEQLGVSQAIKDTWGITPLILTLALIHAIYVITTDTLFVKRVPWVVTVGSIVIYTMLFGAIIESSGNTNILYRFAFGTMVFFTGMLGLYLPVTLILTIWLILGLTIAGIFEPTNASTTFNFVVDTLITIAGIGGWLFFRKYYILGSDKQTRKLIQTIEEEQFKSGVILESITDGVMIISPTGTVQALNKSAAAMLGWQKNEAEKLDYHSLLTVEPESQEAQANEDAITTSLKLRKTSQKLSLIRTAHQRHIYIDIVASPILEKTDNKKGADQIMTGIVAVLRNVDEQKRQEQQRSDFISTASHEMRTPVASIQGYLELALNPKISQLQPKTKVYLDKAYGATKHLGQLFQDLLTVSKSEDGHLINRPEIIDINRLLAALCEEQAHVAAQKHLILQCEQANNTIVGENVQPLIYVNADQERLREVLLNLIENAIKYTVSGTITLGAKLKDENALIYVTDTGSGIAEEDIPHLFQKFYRVDNSATREIGGTGLGLFIVKQIVDLLGGRVWVESKLGEGSTFFVELPRANVENLANPTPAEPTTSNMV